MSKSLEIAVFEAIRKGLDRSPDKFIRIALSSDYPLENALNELFLLNDRVLVGLLSPYKNADLFKDSHFPIETNAAVLTELRNSRALNSKPIVLLGLAIGAEE